MMFSRFILFADYAAGNRGVEWLLKRRYLAFSSQFDHPWNSDGEMKYTNYNNNNFVCY